MNSYTWNYNFGYHSTDDRLKGNDTHPTPETSEKQGLAYTLKKSLKLIHFGDSSYFVRSDFISNIKTIFYYLRGDSTISQAHHLCLNKHGPSQKMQLFSLCFYTLHNLLVKCILVFIIFVK